MISNYGATSKADESTEPTPDSIIDDIIDGLDFMPWTMIVPDVQDTIASAMQDGGTQALAQVSVSNNVIADTVARKLADDASFRAAEMVGKKWVDGELVDNPDAKWVITDSTRDMLRADIEKAYDEGWSTQQLRKNLSANYAFSDARSDMIARTEIAVADIHGNMMAYRESGVVAQKKWIGGAACCDICTENALAGPIGIDEEFPSGDDAPPAHPNCRCDIAPITTEE